MPESSILAKVDDLIDEALGLSSGRLNYKHKTTCLRLSKATPPPLDGVALIENILAQIDRNWHQGKSTSNNQNWRWEKKTELKTKSPEVMLERRIVRNTGNDWVNQVPVASGVTKSAGGRRAIDLVHRYGDGWYDFIELKANGGGGTPLFAAMEILQYGVLYIFSRDNAQRLGYTKNFDKWVPATGIHLKVLAPADYYEEYNLSWLERAINEGLAAFMARRTRGYEMDFKFESLSFGPSSLTPLCFPVKWRELRGSDD